jgi:hypothetical protein
MEAAQAEEETLLAAPSFYIHSLAVGRWRLVLEGRKEVFENTQGRRWNTEEEVERKEDLRTFSLSLSRQTDRVHTPPSTTTTSTMLLGEGGNCVKRWRGDFHPLNLRRHLIGLYCSLREEVKEKGGGRRAISAGNFARSKEGEEQERKERKTEKVI